MENEDLSYKADEMEPDAAESKGKKQTMEVPILATMDELLLKNNQDTLLQMLNAQLAEGVLSNLIGKELVSDCIRQEDCLFKRTDYWRINHTDLYADMDVRIQLRIQTAQGEDTDLIWFCLSVWFSFADSDWNCEMAGITLAENKPDRTDFWKLDKYLVPVLRRDEIEAASEELWAQYAPETLKEPKFRSARLLADRLGLKIVRLPLYKSSHVQSALFFLNGSVMVQQEQPHGVMEEVPPKEVPVVAKTIVVNSSYNTCSGELGVYHECIHYCWHYLFFCLQDLYSSDLHQIRRKHVSVKAGSKYADPLGFMEQQAHLGSFGLMMPASFMHSQIKALYEKVPPYAKKEGYYFHDGFRYDSVGRDIAGEYGIPKGLVRARMLQLLYTPAHGALNYVDGHYITPFAFSDGTCSNGNATYVISRDAVAALYEKEPTFRRIMQTGMFAYVDGHVAYCDSSNVIVGDKSTRLSAWANAHVDRACLRFSRVYSSSGYSYKFGRLNSEQAWKDSMMFLDRSGSMCEAEAQRAKEKLMEDMPMSFHGALTYIMKGRVTVDELVNRIPISRRTLLRLRTTERKQYDLDQIFTICLGLHLPPWLSEVLLDKAGLTVKRYGPKGYYGTILDCYYMDTFEEIKAFMAKNNYPALDLQAED